MRAFVPGLLLLTLFLVLAACTTPNTRSGCASARECTISGMLSPARAESVDMGRMDLPNGECVGVSLPDPMLDTLLERGPYETTVRGRVFEDPGPDADANIAQMLVNGRRIGRGLCGGQFFVFVY